MGRLIAHLIANGLTLILLAAVMPSQVSYGSYEAAAIFAVVLTLLNLILRPILQLIALPLTCLTLGLFSLVVNAAVFYLASRISAETSITYLGAFVGALVAGVLNSALTSTFDRD
jgi:putative membrane protein